MGRKWCRYCGKWFTPDPRVGDRQRACSPLCQRLRKRENNRVFAENNPGYWKGRYEYVKGWRKKHPDYQRQWREERKETLRYSPSDEIQAEILKRTIDSIERNLIVLRKIQAEIILKAIDNKAKKAILTLRVH